MARQKASGMAQLSSQSLIPSVLQSISSQAKTILIVVAEPLDGPNRV